MRRFMSISCPNVLEMCPGCGCSPDTTGESREFSGCSVKINGARYVGIENLGVLNKDRS